MSQPSRLLIVLFAILSLRAFTFAQDEIRIPGAVKLTNEGRQWVDETLKGLSLEEKVGQMLQLRYFSNFQNFDSDEYKLIREQLQKYHIGSVVLTIHVDGGMLLKVSPIEAASVANQLQRDSKLPLLIAADFEHGLSSRLSNSPSFPDAMAFGAIGSEKDAEEFGAITARESRAIGFHWNLAPVADVNSNPANPIINTRSFGEDPEQVSKLVDAFIKGSRANGMLTTAKHFPGHGDTSSDSHLGVAKVDGDLSRLKAVEFPPFASAIKEGVDSVLIAHVAVPALDTDANHVATISPQIVTGVLKDELGFKGLVVTDAMEMRGLSSLYPPGMGNPSARGAVDAIKAGNDVIMWPTDLDGAFHGVLDAVKKGEISETQIDASVRKILEMKASVGLYQNRLVDLQQVSYAVSKPEDLQFAQHVADEAVTLVRDNGQTLPLARYQVPPAQSETFQTDVPPARQVVAIIITDSIHDNSGRQFEVALKLRRADATVFYVDNSLAAALMPQIMDAVKDAGKVVVAAYIVPTAAKQVMVNGKLVNSVGLEEGTGQLLRQVLKAAAPKTAVIAMGNPYLAQNFPEIQTYICTYANGSSSEVSAVKALFGEIHSHGKLPVTLPGVAQRGFSLPWRSEPNRTATAASAPVEK